MGGPTTVNVALAVLPLPPSLEVTLPLTLFLTPAVVAVTLTETVQVPLAARVPPLKVKVVSPGFGAKDPPQDADAFGEDATWSPEGRESVNPTPVNDKVVFGLVIVNVKVEAPPTGIWVGLNALLIEGGAAIEIEALAVLP